MRARALVIVFGAVALLSALSTLGHEAVAQSSGDADLRQRAAQIFGTPPAVAESKENPVTEEKVALGRMLYYDKRLSIANDIACNSCHLLSNFGVDNQPTSPGHKGQRGDRNSPTVYNAAFHVAQFWDGRAPTVEEQAKGPVLNAVEMGMPSDTEVLTRLRGIDGYVKAFRTAFPGETDPVTYDNFGRAVGAFERKLVTPAPFDDYLAGKTGALTEQQRKGLDRFITSGCVTCHSGPLFGGAMFQKLGLVKPYPTKDPGRFNVTKNEADRGFFKVPSLRNVAKTGPYLHDGSIATLPQAVRLMGEYQLGRTLAEEDVTLIVAFLEGLTGRIDEQYVKEPPLPK